MPAEKTDRVKATPGPWEVRASGVQSQGGDAGTFVAKVGSGLVARCFTNLPNMSPHECLAEAQANARLIAAAPELLEACKQINGYWNGHYEDREYLLGGTAPLRAAITKATGA